MSEWITMIAELLWIALGIIFFIGMRRWNKRFSTLYDELEEQIKEG